MNQPMNRREKRWDFDQYDWIQSYDERMRTTQHLHYEETLSRVIEIAAVRQGDLILDIGTGTGNLAVKLLEKGCEVIGLDPSTELLKMAEKKVIDWKGRFRIQLCKDPFLTIPFPEHTFNAVVSTFSIHHICDDEKRLSVREIKRTLKPNGQIIIGDVMFKDADDKIRALAEYPDLEDEYQPLLDTFPDMFENEGFDTEVEQVADTVWIVSVRLK